MEEYHFTGFPEWLHHTAENAGHAVPGAGGFVEWLVGAIGSGLVGLLIGGIIAAVVSRFHGKAKHH
jgi:hypothetical protein